MVSPEVVAGALSQGVRTFLSVSVEHSGPDQSGPVHPGPVHPDPVHPGLRVRMIPCVSPNGHVLRRTVGDDVDGSLTLRPKDSGRSSSEVSGSLSESFGSRPDPTLGLSLPFDDNRQCRPGA